MTLNISIADFRLRPYCFDNPGKCNHQGAAYQIEPQESRKFQIVADDYEDFTDDTSPENGSSTNFFKVEGYQKNA